METLEAMTGLLNLTTLAGILGVHRMTLYGWTKAGKVPAVRVGSRWKYDPAQIAGWYAARQRA
jgi:excisionase family DNA binding protein